MAGQIWWGETIQGIEHPANHMHAVGLDALSESESSTELMGIDQDLCVGTIPQKAANPTYRYDPGLGRKHSDFFPTVNPTPAGTDRSTPSPSG